MGALLNWVNIQRNAQPGDKLIFSIVGWHALTLPQDPKALSDARREMLAVLLAIGLDPERSIIFHQDDVGQECRPLWNVVLLTFSQNPNHTELAWILNCITPMGKLRRMTTWKVSSHNFSLIPPSDIVPSQSRLATSRNARDESEVDESLLNVGLFTYPVLQAADILAYK